MWEIDSVNYKSKKKERQIKAENNFLDFVGYFIPTPMSGNFSYMSIFDWDWAHGGKYKGVLS